MSRAIVGILFILLISALGGWRLSTGKPQEKPLKIMMFVGYFWLLTFLQLFLFAVFTYFSGQRFFLL